MQKKPEILALELCDRRDSGFIQDDTLDSPHKIRLNCSDISWIPNESYATFVEKNEDGSETLVQKFIRYVANDRSIDAEDQEKRKVPYNRKSDAHKIHFKKGLFTLTKTPSTRALWEYMTSTYLNEDAPHRPDTADALFRVIKVDKKVEAINEDDAIRTEAKNLVYSLRKRDGKGGFIYEENKIDAYCNLIGSYGAESFPQKIAALAAWATARPLDFIKLISVFDNTITTEVAQALELRLISFEGGVASFSDGDKIIKPLGSEATTKDKKIEIVADFLKTPEGNEMLTELRARVEIAKQNKLKNK